MKKNVFLTLGLLSSSLAYSQVGVNTVNPNSTVDITAKNSTGKSTNVDGLLIPRVDRERAQNMSGVPESTMIFVNNIATGTQAGLAANIDATGYYFFDGAAWIKIGTRANSHIYNSDGSLTANRTVQQDDKTLAFTGNTVNAFSVDGNTLSVDAANNRVGVGTTAPSSIVHVVNETANDANGLILENKTAGKRIRSILQAQGITGESKRITMLVNPDYNENNGAFTITPDPQGQTSGGKEFVMDMKTGYIGLHTGDPTNTLHVKGSVKIEDGTQGADKVLTSDADGVATWKTPSGSGNGANIYTNDGALSANRTVTQSDKTLAFTGSAVNAFSVDGNTLSVDAANNRVGVGTTAPSSNVHIVNQNAATTDALVVENQVTSANVRSVMKAKGATGDKRVLMAVNPDYNGNNGAFVITAPGSAVGGREFVMDMKYGNIGMGTATPHPSAVLDLTSTTQGLLTPRMTTTQRNAISNKPEGLVIYNTTTKAVEYFNGTSWVTY